MPKVRVKKKHGVLVPALPHDALYFESIKSDTILEFNLTKPRNAKFHDKYFGMVNTVLLHSDKWENIDQLREILLIGIGHCDTVWNPIEGEWHHKAKSIAFAKLDEVKFNRIYQDTLTIILKHFLPGWDEATFDSALNSIMDFA